MEYTSADQFFNDSLPERIAKNPDRAKKIGGVFEFVLDGDGGGTWGLDLTAPAVAAGPAANMNVRIRMKAADFVELVNGRLNEMAAFTQGRLKVEGNIAMALKLREVLQSAGW